MCINTVLDMLLWRTELEEAQAREASCLLGPVPVSLLHSVSAGTGQSCLPRTKAEFHMVQDAFQEAGEMFWEGNQQGSISFSPPAGTSSLLFF